MIVIFPQLSRYKATFIMVSTYFNGQRAHCLNVKRPIKALAQYLRKVDDDILEIERVSAATDELAFRLACVAGGIVWVRD